MICSIEDCQYRSVNSDGLCLAHFRAKAKPAATAEPAVEPELDDETTDEEEETSSKWWHKDEG
jgi:hypothetical protein